MTDTTGRPRPDDAELERRAREILEQSINPALKSHGGFARLVKVEDGRAHVELGGGCQGCPGAKMTIKQGIEARLREELPGLRQVVDATDHGS